MWTRPRQKSLSLLRTCTYCITVCMQMITKTRNVITVQNRNRLNQMLGKANQQVYYRPNTGIWRSNIILPGSSMIAEFDWWADDCSGDSSSSNDFSQPTCATAGAWLNVAYAKENEARKFLVTGYTQGRSHLGGGYKSFLGGIKLLNSRSDVIFTP